jgi:Rrf2 family protein
MRLTTRSRYGTRLVLDIAQNQDKGPVSVSQISKRQDISVKYLEGLIWELKKAGYIDSVRGAKGGHLLNKAPEHITIAEIVDVLEGNSHLVECDPEDNPCPRAENCPTRRLWKDVEQLVYDKLSSVTIKDLMQQGNLLELD